MRATDCPFVPATPPVAVTWIFIILPAETVGVPVPVQVVAASAIVQVSTVSDPSSRRAIAQLVPAPGAVSSRARILVQVNAASLMVSVSSSVVEVSPANDIKKVAA